MKLTGSDLDPVCSGSELGGLRNEIDVGGPTDLAVVIRAPTPKGAVGFQREDVKATDGDPRPIGIRTDTDGSFGGRFFTGDKMEFGISAAPGPEGAVRRDESGGIGIGEELGCDPAGRERAGGGEM